MPTAAEHVLDIASPSRLAMKIGKRVTGFDFVMYRWLAYVEARILDAIMDPEERFLIINLPPRVGKSVLSGVFVPSWFLGMFPEKRVIFATYSDDFSAKFGRAVRTIIDRFGHELFGVGVDRSAQSVSDWQMKNSFGGMLSTGVGGTLTGTGGDCIIIDDILKNIQEARSQTVKQTHMDWYDSTLRTRLEPGGTILITATRWAEDDISGRLIERMAQPGYDGDQYEVIALPALAEPGPYEEFDPETWRDEIGRKIGESLNPEKMPAAKYVKVRNSIDAFMWACLYQQKPILPEGGMFPRGKWKFWNPQTIPKYENGTFAMSRTVRAWDLATTEKAGDYTVGVKMGISGNGDLYVLDMERGQWSTSEVERRVKACAAKDGYSVKIIIEQEKAGAGKTVVESYQRMLAGYTLVGGTEPGSKEQRATPYSAMQQNGRVWLPEGELWLKTWMDEHQAMQGDGRRPRHDDAVDCSAYCALDLLGTGVTEMWVPGQDNDFLSSNQQVSAILGESIFDLPRY